MTRRRSISAPGMVTCPPHHPDRLDQLRRLSGAGPPRQARRDRDLLEGQALQPDQMAPLPELWTVSARSRWCGQCIRRVHARRPRHPSPTAEEYDPAAAGSGRGRSRPSRVPLTSVAPDPANAESRIRMATSLARGPDQRRAARRVARLLLPAAQEGTRRFRGRSLIQTSIIRCLLGAIPGVPPDDDCSF